MKIVVSIDDFFCAAHRFDRLPTTRPEHRLHGHTWSVRASWTASTLNGLGVVQEASVLRALLNRVVDPLRHTLLNDVDGLASVSGEGLALWIYERLALAVNAGEGVKLVSVEVSRELEGIKAIVCE